MKTLNRTEKAAEIRQALKEIGISNRQVSVRGRRATYSDAISLTVKDLSVDRDKVEKIAQEYRSVDYCRYSNEVLEGGNTYVSVSYCYLAEREGADNHLGEARATIKEGEGLDGEAGYFVRVKGDWGLLYVPRPPFGGPEVIITKKRGSILDRVKSYPARDAMGIAVALAHWEARYA